MKMVNYVSQVKTEACTGCKKCETICPPAAIKMKSKKAQVDESACLACNKCWHICPEDAITIAPRAQPIMATTDPNSVDQEAIETLCKKARLFPEQIICACSLTAAKEVAAAVLNGAKTPEQVTSATGVRAGCSIYCIAPVFKILKAHNVKISQPKDHRWYFLPLSLWDVPEEIEKKYPEYFLTDDKNELCG